MHRSHLLWPSTALLLATALAACGSDDPDQSGTDETPQAATTTADDTTAGGTTSDTATMDTATTDTTTDDAATATEGEAMGTGPVVSVTDTSLGPILVDSEGMTLYLFTQDSPDTSVCFDECLAAWPILEGEPTAGEGADESLLGSFTREDGTVHATYAGWPLYYFTQDQAPGDLTGQAVNDVWWVVDADGAAVTGAPEESGDDGGLGY